MRPLSLLAALATLAAPALATPARAGRSLALGRHRGGLAVPLPGHPWPAVQRVGLPSPTATPAVALPGGEIAVGLEAPPGLALIAPEGDRVRVVALPRRITQPLAVARDGRVWVVADRFVFTVAPDGTVRSTAELLGRVEGPALVRADGSAVVVGGSNAASNEFTLLSPEGDPVGVRATGVRGPAEHVLLRDDRVVCADDRAMVFLDGRGALTRAATTPGLRHFAPLGAGLAMTTERALLLTDGAAVVARRVELPGAPLWLAPLDDRRVGVALPGAVPQLWVVDDRGAVTARSPLPHGSAAPLVDPTGAALVPSRGGDILCLDRDGAERWRLTVDDALRPPAVPLPRGGVAIATEGSQVLLLRDGP